MIHTACLPSGLRLVVASSESPIACCGFAVRAGTRDEAADCFGLAHFVEHGLFKGTKKRKAWHILNRMETVGGELNAYTTKEETFVYAVCLSQDSERAIELLGDLVFHADFPAAEMDKEREVVIDEIRSYEDNPSELILDEFENLIFQGSDYGHSILGTESSLLTFTTETCQGFTQTFYRPDNMIFFYHGQMPFNKIYRQANKYFVHESAAPTANRLRTTPLPVPAKQQRTDRGLHQSHVIVGGRAYTIHDKNRMALYLLNNLLGGPGMNSRLNISLREKQGLVYTVESGLTSYSDTGLFHIYFGCDADSVEQCLRLIHKELRKLRDTGLTTNQLSAAAKQLKGQIGIAHANKENTALGIGRTFLHCNRCDTLPEIYQKIDAITTSQILAVANEIFDENRLSQLIFE